MMLKVPKDDAVREKYCLDEVYKYHSHAMKRMYLEKFFDTTQRNKIENMIKSIRDYLRDKSYIVNTAMDQRTRAAAVKKVWHHCFVCFQMTNALISVS